jgi:hypothetical protein
VRTVRSHSVVSRPRIAWLDSNHRFDLASSRHWSIETYINGYADKLRGCKAYILACALNLTRCHRFCKHVRPKYLSLPNPSSRLARYRVLSPNAGVHVSPLQLGAASIGDKWQKFGMGSMDKASSFKLLDAFYDAGGNFIDTANS